MSQQPTYQRFTLFHSVEGRPAGTKCYESATPVTWRDARDRLARAGALDLAKAGSYSDGWMLSVAQDFPWPTEGVLPLP